MKGLLWNLDSFNWTEALLCKVWELKANDRTERRPECGGLAAAKRAASMTHVGRSAQATC